MNGSAQASSVNTGHLEVAVSSFTSILHSLCRDYDIVYIHPIPLAIFAGLPRLFGRKTTVKVHGLVWTDVTRGPFFRALMKAFEYPAAHWSNVLATVSDRQSSTSGTNTGAESTCGPATA
jgi:hypothetical protein